MARKTIDFTTGHPARQLLLFSWPLILAMVLQNFYNMADTLVVGRFVGDTAMGAVGTAARMGIPGLLVEIGDPVVGSQTPIARLKSHVE